MARIWVSGKKLCKKDKCMNICFFVGKICSEINFEFILNSKDIAITIFHIELLNGSIIKIKGYNEIADYCYSNLKTGQVVEIEGNINNNMEIVLNAIYNLE